MAATGGGSGGVSAGAVRAGQAFVELKGDDSDFNASIERVQHKLHSFARPTEQAFKKFGSDGLIGQALGGVGGLGGLAGAFAIGGPIGLATAGVGILVDKVVQFADKTKEMADRAAKDWERVREQIDQTNKIFEFRSARIEEKTEGDPQSREAKFKTLAAEIDRQARDLEAHRDYLQAQMPEQRYDSPFTRLLGWNDDRKRLTHEIAADEERLENLKEQREKAIEQARLARLAIDRQAKATADKADQDRLEKQNQLTEEILKKTQEQRLLAANAGKDATDMWIAQQRAAGQLTKEQEEQVKLLEQAAVVRKSAESFLRFQATAQQLSGEILPAVAALATRGVTAFGGVGLQQQLGGTATSLQSTAEKQLTKLDAMASIMGGPLLAAVKDINLSAR